MSWLVAAYIGVKTYTGYKQGKKKAAAYKTGKAAAYDIYQEKLGLLGEKKGIAMEQIDLTKQKIGLESDIAGAQFRSGQTNIGMGANIGLRNIQAFGEQAYSQANLATSGTIGQKVQTQEGDIRTKYKSDITKLFESQQFAKQQQGLQLDATGIAKDEAILAYKGGEVSAEEQYQRLLMGLDKGGGTEGAWAGFTSALGDII